MKESQIEQRFKAMVEKETGAIVLKFVSPGNSGVPDRIVLAPGGRTYFVELKQSGQKPRPLQRYMMRKFIQLGHRVDVIDSVEAIGPYIESITEERGNC